MTTVTTTTERRTDIALALLRVVIGIIFLAHGGQKLFVYGFAGVTAAFGQMGLPFPGVVGPLVALVEFFGGLALVLGLLTRLASVGIAATMLGAIFVVHLKAGFFGPAGIEFPLALLAGSVALAVTGAGAFSADGAIAARRGAR